MAVQRVMTTISSLLPCLLAAGALLAGEKGVDWSAEDVLRQVDRTTAHVEVCP